MCLTALGRKEKNCPMYTLCSGVSNLTLLVVGRFDCIAPIITLAATFSPALPGPPSSAPVPAVPIARSALPEGLISTDDCIR